MPLRDTARRFVGTLVGRLPGVEGIDPADDVVEKVPDDLPRDSLFAQPLIAAPLEVTSVDELDDDRVRVTFRLTVRDQNGRRCPDLAVEARVTGPERSATGEATTDLMGRITFRMEGPKGDYRCDILHVAAHALAIDEGASTLTLTHPA